MKEKISEVGSPEEGDRLDENSWVSMLEDAEDGDSLLTAITLMFREEGYDFKSHQVPSDREEEILGKMQRLFPTREALMTTSDRIRGVAAERMDRILGTRISDEQSDREEFYQNKHEKFIAVSSAELFILALVGVALDNLRKRAASPK